MNRRSVRMTVVLGILGLAAVLIYATMILPARYEDPIRVPRSGQLLT